MRQLFLCVLSLSLSGAFTGVVLLLIRPLTGKCFSKKWNYYIWLLLIVRLLVPVHFGMPDKWLQAGSEKLTGAIGLQKETPVSVISENEKETADSQLQKSVEEPDLLDSLNPKNPAGTSVLEKSSQSLKSLEPLVILATVWLVGACLCFIIKMTNYMGFNRYTREGSKDISDRQILLLMEDLCRRLHIKKQPTLRESTSVSGPITIGLFRPVIILPSDDFSGEHADADDYNRQTLILHHELLHVRRRDLWYKWLYQLLLCIHWFNPVLYLVGRKLNRDCELSCDEEVLKILNQDGKKAYGNLLITVAERNLCVQKNVLSTTLLERKEDLRERLRGILQYKKQGGGRKAVSLCAVLGLLFLSACGSVQAGPDAMPIQVSREIAEEDMSSADISYHEDEEEDAFAWTPFWGSLIERLFDYDVDDFLKSRMIVNKSGKAWKAYDDDELLAGKDISGQRSAYIYSGGGNRVSCSGLLLNGAESIRILTVEEETKLQIDSSFELIEGRFKIIHVSPEGQVAVINETGESSSEAVTLKKGRNVIKMVGQGGKLRKLEIHFSRLGEDSTQNVYYSEADEYADLAVEEIRNGQVNKKELFNALVYMKDEKASQVLELLLENEIPLDADEIYELLIYSDVKKSGQYLVDAVKNGKYKIADENGLANIILYLDDEDAGEILRNVMDDGEFFTFRLLAENIIYLGEEEQEQCILHYLERGYSLTYSQFAEISPYLSERTIEKIDDRMG